MGFAHLPVPDFISSVQGGRLHLQGHPGILCQVFGIKDHLAGNLLSHAMDRVTRGPGIEPDAAPYAKNLEFEGGLGGPGTPGSWGRAKNREGDPRAGPHRGLPPIGGSNAHPQGPQAAGEFAALGAGCRAHSFAEQVLNLLPFRDRKRPES